MNKLLLFLFFISQVNACGIKCVIESDNPITFIQNNNNNNIPESWVDYEQRGLAYPLIDNELGLRSDLHSINNELYTNFMNQDFTIEIWFQPIQYNTDFIHLSNPSDQVMIGTRVLNENMISFNNNLQAAFYNQAQFTPNSWTHFVLIHSVNGRLFWGYCNGTKAIPYMLDDMADNVKEIQIKGNIAYVAIYDKQLTDEQVATHFNAHLSTTTEQPILIVKTYLITFEGDLNSITDIDAYTIQTQNRIADLAHVATNQVIINSIYSGSIIVNFTITANDTSFIEQAISQQSTTSVGGGGGGNTINDSYLPIILGIISIVLLILSFCICICCRSSKV
jgi:hypothetical protein